MTETECRSWLTTHGEGRLGYLSGRGQRQVVVPYALAADALVVRIPAYNEIAQYVPGRLVTLDVTGRAGDDMVEEVEVTGHAYVGQEPSATVLHRLPNEHWPDSLSHVVLTVVPEKVSGHVVEVHGAPTCL